MSIKLNKYARLMRLDKPVGIWLLMFPCWWGVALASDEFEAVTLLLFAVGAMLMRSAGCVINDIADRKLDAQVERTKNRPLASGEISMKKAVILLAILFATSLAIAVVLGVEVVALGIITTPLVIAYPFMKRITWWPQAFLGITFNAGILFGWVAVQGIAALNQLAPWILFAGAICWTIGYDTIYAHQDKKDDEIAGIKSTARYFATNTKYWVGGFYVLFILSIICIGLMTGLGMLFYAIISFVALHLASQIKRLDINNSSNCMALFKENIWVGLLVFLALM